MVDVWILGGTGRTGRGVADHLVGEGIELVLVGRDASRLRAAAEAGGHRTVVAAGVEAMAAAIREARPTAVVNTVGPFGTTAPALVDACLAAGADYVDLANDMLAVPALLARQAEAEQAGCTLVTGAGFGVTATESVVTWLCSEEGVDGRRAVRVRTDMVPSLALQAGALGEALAGTLVDGLPGVAGGGRFQGRRYADGHLAPAPIAGEVHALVTPDGDHVSAGLMPLGELVAARRASGAPYVDSASSEVPTGRVVGVVLPLAINVLAVTPLRRFAARRLAAVRFQARPAPRTHSWGHAVVTWEDGTTSEGWLQLGEAQGVTDATLAEVARRLARGEGRPGAFTPAALFGPELATSLGGVYSRSDGAQA